MAIMLPSELSWVLNMLGFNWPNIDEDQLRDAASDLRNISGTLGDKHGNALQTIDSMLQSNDSETLQEFNRFWSMLAGKHLPDVIKGLDLLADALEVGADVVVGMKTACITQIGILAAEILGDQVAAAFTFGGSEAAIPAEAAVTDGILDEIVDQAEKQITNYIEQVLLGPLFDAAKSAAANVATQLLGDALGVQSGFSLSSAAAAATSGAKTGVKGIQSIAADPGGSISQAFGRPPAAGGAVEGGE
ncbi:MAG TPA: hypothetical protein VGM10_03465 [Actinocrinis sp.]|jgi:hypothetical protein